MDFTIVIPTYNGANRLPLVLDRLRQQRNTEHLNWEIIVIDNNSKDKTKEVFQEYQENWNDKITLRYSFAAEQGLAFARWEGILAARGELIGFLDDDILPDNHWVAAAYSFGKEHPQAGAFGGQIRGNFAVKPPENFSQIQSFFAIRERGEQLHLYDPDNLSLPPGAALVVRKQAWCECVPQRSMLIGRVGGKMLAGEDFEVLLYMHKAGWEIWYNPAMHADHQIPERRLEKDYLLSLIRGCGLTICHLRMINAKKWQKPVIMGKIILGGLRRYLQHWLKYGTQVQTDAIAAGEREFYLSSLVSPFFFIKTSLDAKFVEVFGKKS
ncbi:hormogonium polysaccharide biosynthesis glycosyltransferase HpsE [Aerosakkonemataceae cyanobacterium BLCC-F154]|uniref:Hormogonium polysaccharide biosynthesis glycosyltransferase HpsE n=1 Tax=Floridaenema fluviatile BLCC-F154 TaxID=3153640 RepID=A0ABV4YAV9_9CYAN